MNRQIRVIQYGVGPIGAAIVRLMLDKPGLLVTGAVDTDPEKPGRTWGTWLDWNGTSVFLLPGT